MSAKTDAILAKYGVNQNKTSVGSSADAVLQKYGIKRVGEPMTKPETQSASPVGKQPTMNQLEEQLRQAQVDLDTDAMIRIGDQMKQMRAESGRQTLADRVGNVVSGTTNTSMGQYLNAAGTLMTGVEYNDKQIKRLQETLKSGRSSDGRVLNDAQRARIETAIAEFQRKNAEVRNDPNHAGNRLQQTADRLSATGEQQIEAAKTGLGEAGQFAVDLGVGGLQLAGDIAANAILPGSGMVAMGARAFGGGAQEARKQGATESQQMLYGAGSAAVGLLTEKIANVAGPFKKAFGGGVLDDALGKISSKPAGKLLLSALSEGGEEMLESTVQPILQRLTYDPEAAYDSDWLAETLYSGALGAVLGGLGGSVDVIGGKRENAVDPEWQKTITGIAPEKQSAFNQAKEIAERFGTTLSVGKLENGAAGEYLNGRITIDPNAKDPVRQVLVHELTHHMETSGLYSEFSNMVMDYIANDMHVDVEKMRQEIMADYSARGKTLDNALADRELVAKFAEDMLFQDEKTIERLLLKDRNLFERIYDWIRDAVKRMRGTEQEAFLVDAQNLYEKALRKAGTQKSAEVEQNTFGGVNARTADLKALTTAQQMETQGADANEIRQETGWFRGMDGKWRFEISDEGMQYFWSGDAMFTQNHPEYAEYQELSNKMLYGTIAPDEHARLLELGETWGREPRRLQDRLSGGAARLQDIIRHDALFEAYPELRDVRVRFSPMDSDRGQYNRRTNTITLNESIKNAPENTIVHEVQHAIQEAEDFAGGASIDYWEDQLRNDETVRSVGYEEAMRKLQAFTQNPENTEVIRLNWMLENAENDEDYDLLIREAEESGLYDRLSEYTDLIWQVEAQRSRANNQVPSELYRNTAGEIEARDVTGRRTWTQDQRRTTVPDLGNENTVFAGNVPTNKEYIGKTADGTEIYETTARTKAMSYKERMDQFLNLMETQFRGRTAKFTNGNQTYYALFDKDDVNKNIYGDKKSDTQGWKAKINVGAEGNIFELVENAKYNGNRPETGKTNKAHQGVSGWDYFVKTVQIDGRVFDVVANVRKKPDGEYVYSIQLNENKNKAPAPLLAPAGNSKEMLDSRAQNRVLTNAYGNNVSRTGQNVKDPYDIIPNLAEMAGLDKPGQNSMGRSFRELAKAQEKTEAATDIIPNLAKEAGLEVNATRANLTTKEREYLKKAENTLTKRIGWALSVPSVVQREDLKPIVQQISDAYLRDGTVDQELVDSFFETAYQNGIETDTQFYDQHKEIKNFLRNNAVSIRDEDKVNIADYGDFRRAAMGTLNISKNGTPVDILYERLKSMDPSLFPADITDPAEQLQRMFEVGRSIQKVEKTLTEYYGADAETFKRFAKHDFEDAVNQTAGELNNVRRHALESERKKAAQMTNPAQVKAAYEGIRKARKNAERAMARELLTDADKVQLDRLLKGEIELKDLKPGLYNVRGIQKVYEAKLEYEKLNRVVKEYKRQHTKKLRDEADADLATALNWKDKPAGILYSRETMERNIRDIVPDEKTADEIIRKYFEPVHVAQAESTRAKNDYRARVKKLGLSRKVQDGNTVSEAHAVQLLGEAEDNIRVLQESTEKNAKRDGKTLTEWQSVVNELWKQNPKLDRQKIVNAVKEFRGIYDELFLKMNEVRLRNGYEPVAYRQGYFPHFQPGNTGFLAAFANALGIQTDVTNLPTSINGLTHTFRPGITWFGHAQKRLGFDTAYDAVEGFDKYIEGAADVIYQTDNIQRLRALASQIRYKTTDDGIREAVDKIRARTDLDEEAKSALIDKTYKEGKFTLGNFVVELDEYTNLLANKKSRADRNMEQAIGRRGYNLVKALENRVAANMVAVNPTSWLTNFIPLTQGMSGLDSKSLLKGMMGTIKAYRADDGMAELSTFLTNRRGSDPLVKTWAQNASAALSKPMEYIDTFTADTLVRARYEQNLKRGLSIVEALGEADQWAANVMADRSKGATPTLFNRSNPLTKMFTQFQLEVNNQMSYVFKDVPDELKKKGLKALAAGYLKMFVAAWLYNEVYEYFVGRRPAMDPLNILNEFGGDLTGYEIPDLMAMGDLSREDFQTEKEGLSAAGKNLVGNVAEQLPFMSALNLVGINVDSGRIPAANAIPDIPNLWDAATNAEWTPEKRRQEAIKELSKPLTYLAPPVGGGQIKKTLQGIKAVKEGGSYNVNSKGEEILQYPVFNEDPTDLVGNTVRSILFGKSSTPMAQEWVNSGFDSFSAKETAMYQGLTDTGVSQREAYTLLRELGSIQKTDEESANTLKRKALQDSKISDAGKSVVFYGMMASDKEQELMDSAAEADVPEMAKCLMGIKDANLLKGSHATKARMEAIARSGMSEKAKEAVYLNLKPSKQDELEEVLAAGVSMNDWLRFEAQTSGLSTDGISTEKEKVMQVINQMNLSNEQKDALYLAAGYSENTLDKTPWAWDPTDMVGNVLRIGTYQKPELKLPELQYPKLW